MSSRRRRPFGLTGALVVAACSLSCSWAKLREHGGDDFSRLATPAVLAVDDAAPAEAAVAAAELAPAVEPVPAATESTAAPEDDAAPLAPAEPHAQDEPLAAPGPTLISTARETAIYQRPSFASPKIGYMRVGAVVGRDAAPAGFDACKRGFFHVRPDGYVCVDNAASLEPPKGGAALATTRADRLAPMPYVYGRARFPTPPLYTRLPTQAEQGQTEQELVGHLRAGTARAWKNVTVLPIPPELADGRELPTPWGFPREGHPLTTGRALPDSGFALLGVYEREGRKFALSTDFELLPLDRLTPIEPSRFHGLHLDQTVTLPVVFVRSRSANLYTGDPSRGRLSIARRLDYREGLPLSGSEVVVGGVRYLQTKTGDYLKDESLVRIDPMRKRPGWATPGRTWIHVSILPQTLVMYEGEKPIYVTLVSTGKDGLGDPKESHSTIRGQFLIHTKHVSVTMDSDAEEDPFDLRDVPYVQYFTEGFALHAAFWHDSFGRPYSHGCVNLSPIDARALFSLTDPPVPQAWHGAMSLRGGTLVHVTP